MTFAKLYDLCARWLQRKTTTGADKQRDQDADVVATGKSHQQPKGPKAMAAGEDTVVKSKATKKREKRALAAAQVPPVAPFPPDGVKPSRPK